MACDICGHPVLVRTATGQPPCAPSCLCTRKQSARSQEHPPFAHSAAGHPLAHPLPHPPFCALASRAPACMSTLPLRTQPQAIHFHTLLFVHSPAERPLARAPSPCTLSRRPPTCTPPSTPSFLCTRKQSARLHEHPPRAHSAAGHSLAHPFFTLLFAHSPAERSLARAPSPCALSCRPSTFTPSCLRTRLQSARLQEHPPCVHLAAGHPPAGAPRLPKAAGHAGA